MAFDMRKAGISLDGVLAALLAENVRCVPPLTQDEIEKIVEGKKDIHPDPVWAFPTQPPAGGNGTHPGGTPPPTWTDSTPWEEMYATQYPVRQWLITKLIPHGLTIIGGPPKARKTTMAYDIALATVGQGLALNHWGCMPAPVLYCTCEDERGDSKKLVKQLRPQMPATTSHQLRFKNADEVPTFTTGLLAFIREQVERYRFSLVVIDQSMYVLDQPIPRGVDPFVAMRHMLLPFQWLASQEQFALVFVDHTRKPSVQDVDVFSTLYGTHAKQALAMTLMMVSKEGDEVKIETKGRGAGDHKYLFMCTQHDTTEVITWTFGGADQGMLPGARQKMVLQAFANARSAGTHELGPRDVIDYAELQQSAGTYNNIRQALFQMRRKGVVAHLKSGLFTIVDASVLPDPTPVDDDPGVIIP